MINRRKLKVYGGNLDGVHRVIMATTSLTAFCKVSTVSRSMATETGNVIECGVALNEPGILFVTKHDHRNRPYRRLGESLDYRLLQKLDKEEFA